jgi:hypothetical protein
MKTYGGVDVQIYVFVTLALLGGEWSTSGPGGKAPGNRWIGGWVGPRTCLDDMESRKSCP